MRLLFLVLAALVWAGPAGAAVSCTVPTNGSGSDSVNRTSYTTGSISVTGGDLLLVAATVRRASTPPSSPTISNTGTAITWTLVDEQTFNDAANPLHRIKLWRGVSGGSQSVAITFDLGGVTHTAAGWVLAQCSGVDTSTNQGVVQSAKNQQNGNSGTLTITLSAFGSASNGTAGFFASPTTSGTIDVESGSWTLLATSQAGGEVLTTGSEWRADNDTSVTMTTSTGSGNMGGVAVEIKAATAGTPETTFMRRRRGP